MSTQSVYDWKDIFIRQQNFNGLFWEAKKPVRTSNISFVDSGHVRGRDTI